MLPAMVILFYLKRSAPFQVIWISFHNLLKEIKFNRLDDASLRDGFVSSLKSIFIQPLNFVICFMNTEIVATHNSVKFMK